MQVAGSSKHVLDDRSASHRQTKTAKTLGSHVELSYQAPPSGWHDVALNWSGVSLSSMSTVEVWHPKTGQKSYGKERRCVLIRLYTQRY